MGTAGNGRKATLLLAGVGLLLLAIAVRESWSDIAFFFDFERLGKNAQGCAEYRHRKTGIVFVAVPGDPPVEDDGPPGPFLIAKHPLSLEDWSRFTGAPAPPDYGPDARITTNISLEAAHAFCDKMNLLVPTKTQWDHACRPAKTFTLDGSVRYTTGWYVSTKAPSEETPPNVFGLHGRDEIMVYTASSGQPQGHITMGGFRPVAPLP